MTHPQQQLMERWRMLAAGKIGYRVAEGYEDSKSTLAQCADELEAALSAGTVPQPKPGALPQRLQAAIQCVIRETRGFNERKQEAWCRVCRYKDPLGVKLHDPDCPIYELHGAWEEALGAVPQQEPQERRYSCGHVLEPADVALKMCAVCMYEHGVHFAGQLVRPAVPSLPEPQEQDGKS